MKKTNFILDDVVNVYSGSKERLWELIMGENSCRFEAFFDIIRTRRRR